MKPTRPGRPVRNAAAKPGIVKIRPAKPKPGPVKGIDLLFEALRKELGL